MRDNKLTWIYLLSIQYFTTIGNRSMLETRTRVLTKIFANLDSGLISRIFRRFLSPDFVCGFSGGFVRGMFTRDLSLIECPKEVSTNNFLMENPETSTDNTHLDYFS